MAPGDADLLARLEERLWALGDRLEAVAKRLEDIEGQTQAKIDAALAPIRLRLKLVEVIAYGFCAAIFLAVVTALVSSVVGDRATPRSHLPPFIQPRSP